MTLREFSFNMILEEDRKRSFKHWPFNDNEKCNKQRMAEAGFYSSGKKTEPDLAICYICSKELDGWEEDDDPWDEHKKHASYCPFIKLGKKPSTLTVYDFLQLLKQREILMLEKAFQAKKQKLEEKLTGVQTLMEKADLKENEKPRGVQRKRSSRK